MNINFDIDIDKSLPKISISKCLDMLETPFDKQGVAQKTYEKNFNNPESKYYQMDVQQIIESWEAKGAESCHYGSMLDDYIGINLTKTDDDLELWKLDNNYDYDERLHGLCDSYDNFISMIHESRPNLQFVARERSLYLKTRNPLYEKYPETGEYFNINGRFDALFYDTVKDIYVLVDWKSSGTIDRTANKFTHKMLGPMFAYPQLNWYRYTLQLHFYKKALIESGYVPAGTTPDKIVVMIISLPGHQVEGSQLNYQIVNEAIKYDSSLMDKIFEFVIKKKILQERTTA